LASWIEPLIATRIAPIRIVRSVGGLSDGAEDPLARCPETGGAAKSDGSGVGEGDGGGLAGDDECA
jgi:hypothetical protein